MRISRGMIAAAVALAGTVQAQLRLPSVQLPQLPSRSLPAAGPADLAALGRLSDRRHQLIAGLIRSNPHRIEADPRGDPIVRSEIMAFSPSETALQAALALGFRLLREQNIPELELRLLVLEPPPHLSTANALKILREADQQGIYDFNHIYTGVGASGASTTAAKGTDPTALPDNLSGGDSEKPRDDAGMHRIGLIDAGIDVAHPTFRASVIRRWGCAGRSLPSAHGTAVASILVGDGGGFRGVMPGAQLLAADVYCDAPTGGSVDTLAGAFGWLAQERVGVINVSLVGPDNAMLARVVHALTSRGFMLVAAVGNDGPAAPPLYPAAYPQVVAVTAVDAHRRVLIEAGRGHHVMFAAPGADMAAAALDGKYAVVRGTSFAAPIVAGLFAMEFPAPNPAGLQDAVDAMARRAIDLGEPGRDLTYGFGLLGAGYAIELKAVIRRP